MTLKEIVTKARTVRRFKESMPITLQTLRELVDLARLAPCGANKQALRYYLVTQPSLRERVFTTLGWAAYLTDWVGPAEGERPTAYIIQVEEAVNACLRPVDPGFAAQNIILGAAEKGLAEVLGLPTEWRVVYVIALGVPAETVEIRLIDSLHGIKYWREGMVHCVPKRTLDEVIYEEA